jgi:P-type E1-E2 ATPase
LERRFEDVQSREIRVGQFVKVYNDENFPCDLLLINSSLPKGICYIETKGLDGETNLKQKISRPELVKLAESDQDLFKNLTRAQITCDMPNANLYKFQGVLALGQDNLPLSND